MPPVSAPHPETLFELDNTVAVVRGELDKLGIAWSEAGPTSVTAWIGQKDARTRIGIRADMDALPVQKKTDVPFISENPERCMPAATIPILVSCWLWRRF